MNAPSERTRVKRMNKRAKYDAETVHGILDAMPICNVGYVFDGAPYVTPTLQWREGDHLYWHGSSASRMLEACEEAEVCVTVSIIDGFVMARSAFNHSCNYRSVMVLGTARKVVDADEKEARLKAFTEGLWPGRWDMLRQMTAKELKATTVLSLALDEASAKVRNGPAGDDEADYALPIWAGIIPVRTEILAPVDDPRLLPGLAAPGHITGFRIG
ncbi:pyridoxamine 5'-phosphate oxidase family protein [Aestuariivirga sp.]|uniref:pyridoxamine 5'-phosphate oxidase family protein n=1 Tax=Aestuariivirga sp. TaxID=2650926 RepID=UPI003BA89FB6